MTKALILAATLCITATSAYAETAAEFIKRDNPRTVKDVGGNERRGDAMLVGVLDDGTKRDGLADTFCMSVEDFPDAPTTIRIMDVAAATRGEWKVLGQANCNPPSGEAETVIEFN